MVVDPAILTIGGPRLRVEVLDVGATVVGVWVPDAAGRVDNVALRHPELATYADPSGNPYLGSTVGRYANRIGGGRFVLDGTEHRIEPNEGTTCLHGGAGGWSFRRWSVVAQRPDAVTLAIDSPDGEGGFPGAVSATATFRVVGQLLWFEAEATTSAPTPISMTTHTYWNLAGGGTGAGPTVDRQSLHLPSSRIVEVDAGLVPTGRTPAPTGDLDLGSDRPLAGRRVDHAYWPDGPARAVLADPDSGRTLEVTTDQPSIQVYTADHLGPPFGPRRGVCLEPQQLPDAPNQPGFPSATVRPPARYVHRSSFRFGTRAPEPQEGSER